MFYKNKLVLSMGLVMGMASQSALATVWTKWEATAGSPEAAVYAGSYGSITFDDCDKTGD